MRQLVAAAVGAALLLPLLSCSQTQRKPSPAELFLIERTATIFLRQGQAREAELSFRQALHFDPDNPEMHDGLGSALMMQGQVKEALSSFDRATVLSPDRPSYKINRGAALLELGRIGEAEVDFVTALKSPNSDDQKAALLNMGRSRFRAGDYAGAEDYFTRAVELDPQNFQAYLARAFAREAQHEDTQAVADYLAALKIQPQNLQANLRMGIVLLSLQQKQLGQRYLRRVTEIAPDSPEAARARQLLAGEEQATPR